MDSQEIGTFPTTASGRSVIRLASIGANFAKASQNTVSK
jgi:hypothetical protein